MSGESRREYFTKNEAQGLIGKAFEAIADLQGAPLGARGLVVATDHQGRHWLVIIQWERDSRQHAAQKQLSRFTKDEMQRSLREAKG